MSLEMITKSKENQKGYIIQKTEKGLNDTGMCIFAYVYMFAIYICIFICLCVCMYRILMQKLSD